MKWLEVIELRSVESNRELLESYMQALMDEVDKDTSTQTITVYRHVMIHSDVSIHLVHDSPSPDQSESPLGVRLASSLREFGLVNHSVWIEMPSS